MSKLIDTGHCFCALELNCMSPTSNLLFAYISSPSVSCVTSHTSRFHLPPAAETRLQKHDIQRSPACCKSFIWHYPFCHLKRSKIFIPVDDNYKDYNKNKVNNNESMQAVQYT